MITELYIDGQRLDLSDDIDIRLTYSITDIENPVGAYPEFDRYGRCIAFAKRYYMAAGELASQFPEYANILLGKQLYKSDMNYQLEVIRYYDDQQSILYVPERNNLVLSKAKNPINKMMVVVARRPSVDGEMRGQFDQGHNQPKLLFEPLQHFQPH